MNLPIPLTEVFTAPGVVAWAAALAGLVELLKRFVPALPEYGRGVLYMVAFLAAGLVGLAAWEAGVSLSAGVIAGLVLTWAALVTAASGTYEVAAKGGRVLQGTTNKHGADVSG